MNRNNRGFTLIEVIVVAAIIAILAGILVPMIFSQIDESKKTKALADCKSIQTTILAFRKDTGAWPNRTTPTTADRTLLYGAGTLAADADLAAKLFDTTSRDMYINYLKTDDSASYGTTWKGPYLTSVEADPWGNAYITNAKNFDANPAVPVWIISAGPDGKLDTPANSETPVNDDIGIRIK